MTNTLQHPDITRVLENGIGEETPKCYCSKCGYEIYYGEKTYSAGGDVICPECMEEEIKELGTDFLAEVLGYTVEAE